MPEAKKLAFFLPNSFTALNMACGFASIIFSYNQRPFEAALILILGAIFDSVDGRVARLTGTQSSFGEQFDSMSDVVSFGMAPAFLMYLTYLKDFGRLGAVASFIFLLCGALRLARFNANIDKVSSDFFQGLPIPGAALAIVGFIFLTDRFPVLNDYPIVAMVYTVFYGVLMVTTVPFFSFKRSEWIKRHKRTTFFICFILAALTFSYYRIMVGTGMLVYVVGSILFYLKNKKEFGDVFHWMEES